jgi:hypothetical protein
MYLLAASSAVFFLASICVRQTNSTVKGPPLFRSRMRRISTDTEVSRARVFHSATAADTPNDVGVGVHFALRQLALGRITTGGGGLFSRNGSCV